MKKQILAIICTMAFTMTNVSASVLGPTLKESTSLKIGKGVVLNYNKFLSDQKGVGNQSEYFAEYTPNRDVVPVVLTGEDIYGKRTANEIMEYMKETDMIPMLGINASYFSLQTGIPMGHVITDGVVTSKDNRTLGGIGFMADSSAFVEDLYIETTASFGEDYLLQIPHINKFISEETQMLTLYTPDFGDYTGTSTETLNIILEKVSDSVRIGKSFTGTVKEIITSKEPVKINDDEVILSVNTKGNQWAITLLNTMQVGDEITVKTTANSPKWDNALNGIASEGERLIKDGIVAEGLEAGASPRTAVGIKENGNIIFYVIDGRQSGYSYGAKKETVAKRLLELGCVDALNLDGGGSTTMAGVYPGCDNSVIVNSPSDKTLRKVSNFIFLRNAAEPTGIPAEAFIYPYFGNILSGSSLELSVKTVDENFYKTEHQDVTYNCNEYGVITEDGVLTALGAGDINVVAQVSELRASATFKSHTMPDEIKLYNADTSKELSRIDVDPNDTVHMYAQAFYDNAKLISTKDAYSWELSDEAVGTIDADGVLKVSDEFKGEALLKVKAGDKIQEFVVKSSVEAPAEPTYPNSEITFSNNVLTIDMYTQDEEIDTEKSYFKIDGEKFDVFDAEHVDKNHIRINHSTDEVFKNGYHKVFCVTVLKNGYSSINSFEITNKETENIFADTNTHWAKNIISYMNVNGVVNGSLENGVTVYRPEDSVTRTEFAVMAVNFLGLDKDAYSAVSLDGFIDKDKIPEWAKNYVRAAVDVGVISGKSENDGLYFAPDAYITRAEAATIISRMLPENLEEKEMNFSDITQIPLWAERPFRVLSSSNLIKGYEDNTIRPLRVVTRAEAVTMLYNIY